MSKVDSFFMSEGCVPKATLEENNDNPTFQTGFGLPDQGHALCLTGTLEKELRSTGVCEMDEDTD